MEETLPALHATAQMRRHPGNEFVQNCALMFWLGRKYVFWNNNGTFIVRSSVSPAHLVLCKLETCVLLIDPLAFLSNE